MPTYINATMAIPAATQVLTTPATLSESAIRVLLCGYGVEFQSIKIEN